MAFGSNSREFVLKIVTDYRDATKGIDTVTSQTQTMGSKLGGVAKVVGGAFVVGEVVRFGKAATQAASDLEQSAGAVDSVFGNMAGSIHDFGKTAATNIGISNSEFQQMASLMGSLLKNTGLPMEQVSDSTLLLSERAADLAATFGGTAPDAMAAMTSALKGELDPLEAYGVSLKAADIEARAMAEGYVDASGEVTAAGKAIAAQEIIMEQSADKAGTFAKESGTLAGQTQIMQAQMQNLSATLGQQLLPIIVQVAGALQKVVTFVQQNQQWLIPLAAAIGVIVAAIKAWQIAQAALNLVMAMNPIVLVVAAIAGLVAGLVLAYKKSETFREIVDNMGRVVLAVFQAIWDKIKAFAQFVWDVGRTLFEAYIWPYKKAFEIIKWTLEQIPVVAKWVWEQVKRFFGFMTDVMKKPFTDAWTFIDSKLDQMVAAFKWVYDEGKRFFSNLGSAISAPFKAAMDGMKSAWNNGPGRLSFKVPSWVPGMGGKGWSMPKLAAGGIVTRPTIALLGEAGPEAVVPLGRGGMGSTFNINVYALTPTAEVGRKVYEALREYDRTSGKGGF